MIEELFNTLRDYSEFEHKGILSKDLSLTYEIESNQPHLDFNCKENKEHSFRVHELEFGKENNLEAGFWYSASSRGEEAQFKGFISKLYPLIPGIRGILSVESKFHELGLFIEDGRITRKRNQEEMNEDSIIPLLGMSNYLNHLGKPKIKNK